MEGEERSCPNVVLVENKNPFTVEPFKDRLKADVPQIRSRTCLLFGKEAYIHKRVLQSHQCRFIVRFIHTFLRGNFTELNEGYFSIM